MGAGNVRSVKWLNMGRGEEQVKVREWSVGVVGIGIEHAVDGQVQVGVMEKGVEKVEEELRGGQ